MPCPTQNIKEVRAHSDSSLTSADIWDGIAPVILLSEIPLKEKIDLLKAWERRVWPTINKTWPTLNKLDQTLGIQSFQLGQCWNLWWNCAREAILVERPVVKKWRLRERRARPTFNKDTINWFGFGIYSNPSLVRVEICGGTAPVKSFTEKDLEEKNLIINRPLKNVCWDAHKTNTR